MSKETDNDIGTDLCKLAVLLIRHGLCQNVAPLQNAGQSCISKSTSLKWMYNLDKIVFEADEVGGRLPIDAEDISVSLSIKKIEGVYSTSGEIINPLSQLFFDIEIDCYRLNSETSEVEGLYASWHLDKHLTTPGDGKTKYSHPLYHFTFGGNKMEEKALMYGNALIMPSPRFTYPPMDAILGIDFILQNYLSKDKISKLIIDPEYIQVVRNSQVRLWKPFFTSLYSFWDEKAFKISSDFSPVKLLPFYY